MIYIIEGPDGAGKTTLAEKIVKATPHARIVHFGAPATDAEAFNYWETYAKALEAVGEGETVIIDRCWISDLVYGPVMRNRVEMTPMMAAMLNSMVVAHGGGLIIYCTAPTKILWSRCKKRGETYVKTMEKLHALNITYASVMHDIIRMDILPVLRIDTSVHNW